MRYISLLSVVFVGGLLIFGIYLSFKVLPRLGLGIPPAVAIGALLAFLSNFFLQWVRNRSERAQAEAVEVAREQDAALATYAEKLSELITEKNLHAGSNASHVCLVAQALTTYLLRRLDKVHKRQALALVYGMGLIEKGEPLLALSNASLDGADLTELTLHNACLNGADLRLADLHGADLEGSDLNQADLRGANLSGADLSGADLTDANLLPYDEKDPAAWNKHNLEKRSTLNNGTSFSRKGLTITSLRGAILREAQLRKAWLHGVDLSGADLKSVKGITTEELADQASLLRGATMPNGQKYEEWLKSKGSGEDASPS
jgi:uncharacterized protein YjbI with pentapeptide repeats